MGNNDTCTLFFREVVMRIDATLLVLGKESRIPHLTYIMIEGPGTYKGGLGTNLIGYLRCEVSTVIECWKVPGATSESFRSSPLLVSDNSISVNTDTKPKVFSTTNISG